MVDDITCEHCGLVVPAGKTARAVAEGWTFYFCSERCKIQWGERGEVEEEE
jgi:YHS domain-containing protein